MDRAGGVTVEFRTWADVLSGLVPAPGEGMMSMLAGAQQVQPGAVQAVPTVDRAAGEGPPPCCRRRLIAADMLIWYGGLPENALARLRAAFPHLAEVRAEQLYLCDGCRSRITRRGILAPEEIPRQW